MPPGKDGLLAIKRPWPGMIRAVYKNEERFIETYWSKWDGKTYFAGDGAKVDKDGYFRISGRIDDVVKVSGHRIGTAEIESILVSHPAVAEAGVVGKSDPIKGETIYCYVVLKAGISGNEGLEKELIGRCWSKYRSLCTSEKGHFLRRTSKNAQRQDNAQGIESHSQRQGYR